MDDGSAGDVGVATALGRICALEAKLRQAIQHTHLLSSSFESDPAAADREREALLAIREQLELLEDKLRDFKSLRDNQYDDKTVALSQLDSLRRELIACARDRLEFLVFTKDVVREVLTFAEVNSGSSTPDHSTARQDHRPPLSPLQRSLDGTYSPLTSPAASPSPKLRKLQNPMRGSYNEALHLAGHSSPAGDRRVSQSLDFSRLERSDGIAGPSQVPRQSLVGRRMAADAAQRTLDAADSIIFAGPKRQDRSSKKPHSPMLSPGQVRDEALYSSTNGGSRYVFDPDYGGKVSMPKAGNPQPIRPDTTMSRHAPDASRPRALFADERSRSGHGGSVRGDDDTCSLQTTTWSGQQARTPIAVRRLGPLPPVPPPHHQDPAKPTAWLGRIAKLVALGAVVMVSAAGVVKVVDWQNAPAQKHKRATRKANKQLRREEAEHRAWLHAQAHKARLAQEAKLQAQVQQEREAQWQLQQEQLQAMQQAQEEEEAAEALRQKMLLRKHEEAAQERSRQQQARSQAAAEEEKKRQGQARAQAAAEEAKRRQARAQAAAEEEKRRQARAQAAAEEEKRQHARAQAVAEEEKRQQLQKEAEQKQKQLEEQQQAEAARQLRQQQEVERQAKARQEEEERQQQLLAEVRAVEELKKRRELERQARIKEEEQHRQQLLEEAEARREFHKQQQLQEQAAMLQEQQLQQKRQAELKHRRQQEEEEEAAAAAAAHAQAEQAALAAEADAQLQEPEDWQPELVADGQAEQGSASQQPLKDGPKERSWKSTDHWLPQRGAPKVTVVGEKPRGWPNSAAFPALPPPNIFRGQG